MMQHIHINTISRHNNIMLHMHLAIKTAHSKYTSTKQEQIPNASTAVVQS